MVTLVMFSTKTCAYCKPIKQIIENLRYEYDNLAITYIVVDESRENMDIAKDYQVNAVPTIIFIHDSEIKEKHVGNITQELIINGIERYLQPDLFPQSSSRSESGSCSILPSSSESSDNETRVHQDRDSQGS